MTTKQTTMTENIKEQLNEQMDALREKFKALEDNTADEVQHLIKKALGDEFEIEFYSGYKSCSIEVGIKSEESNRFAHSFTLTFAKELHTSRGYEPKRLYVLKMNYPTTGSFSVLEDEKHTKYLAGMGKFASDEFLRFMIYVTLASYIAEWNSINEQYKELEKKLNNQ